MLKLNYNTKVATSRNVRKKRLSERLQFEHAYHFLVQSSEKT
jgi:hypothetical protein